MEVSIILRQTTSSEYFFLKKHSKLKLSNQKLFTTAKHSHIFLNIIINYNFSCHYGTLQAKSYKKSSFRSVKSKIHPRVQDIFALIALIFSSERRKGRKNRAKRKSKLELGVLKNFAGSQNFSILNEI